MKKILILGASSDIGRELTKYFLVRNYKVVAHLNKNSKDLNKLNNKNLKLFKFDLIKIKEFERFVKKDNIFKDIDIFISLTGYLRLNKISQVKVKDFIDHFSVNYLSNFLLTIYLNLKWLKTKKTNSSSQISELIQIKSDFL